MLLKVGELAKRTGLTVRALHHYDSIGLLRPSGRSDSGYRLYNQADVTQLYRIQTLRRLGFSLAEVGEMLAGEGSPLPQLIAQQIATLDEQVAQALALRERLQQLQHSLQNEAEPELADWLTTLELMTMYDKYLNSQQAELLRQRKEELGEQYWEDRKALVADVRSLIARKVAQQDAEAKLIAQRWLDHVQALVRGDEGLLIKLDAMNRNEPSVQASGGFDNEVIAYMSGAIMELRLELYAKYLDANEVAQLRTNFQRNIHHWPALTYQVRKLMEEGVDMGSPAVRDVAQRWRELMHSTFSFGDPVMWPKLERALQNEPLLMLNTGIDAAMMAFIKEALRALPA